MSYPTTPDMAARQMELTYDTLVKVYQSDKDIVKRIPGYVSRYVPLQKTFGGFGEGFPYSGNLYLIRDVLLEDLQDLPEELDLEGNIAGCGGVPDNKLNSVQIKQGLAILAKVRHIEGLRSGKFNVPKKYDGLIHDIIRSIEPGVFVHTYAKDWPDAYEAIINVPCTMELTMILDERDWDDKRDWDLK